MSVKLSPREHAKCLIDAAIRKALAGTSGRPRRGFLQFLVEVRSRSDLLRPARFRGRADAAWLDAILAGLLALSGRRPHWIRPVEGWAPRGSNPLPLFSSLAHHLLTDYPVPPVLLSSWFQGNTREGQQQRRWFIRAGRGKSLRSVGLPIRLTRHMAHLFALAPAHYPIGFALRWAQVRGLGGRDDLALAVAATRLGREFDNDEFWASAILFLINHPTLDLGEVEHVVEYLQGQKFEHRPVIIGEDTEVYVGAPNPDLSLKGWTVSSLLRRVEQWKSQRKEGLKRTLIRWDRSSIGGYAGRDNEGRTWTIRELLDSDELAAEGKAMDHCVATYTDYCSRRLSTIWSVSVDGPAGPERVATVEVNPASREVVQAKARGNEEPDEPCRAVLERWARREGLKLEREAEE
jgi:hypothetical protein